MIGHPDLPRGEFAQMISTALVAARRAVEIIRQAFEAADALLYELETPGGGH